MNREILFRGKRKDNNEWIYGYYVKLYNDKDKNLLHRIYTGSSEKECDEYYEEYDEVIPETIGQYTGLNTSDGRKVFEGDIIDETGLEHKTRWLIVYNTHMMGFALKPLHESALYDFMPVNVEKRLPGKIIGNIHDNPELLYKEVK